MIVSASALTRNCGYARKLNRERPRTPAQQESMDRGTKFHAAIEDLILHGEVPPLDDLEMTGWLDLLMSVPPPGMTGPGTETEILWGLGFDGQYTQPVETKPHVYEPAPGQPALLTAGRADIAWWKGPKHDLGRTQTRMGEGQSGVPQLVQHEDPLPQSEQREVGALRGTRDQGVRALDGLPGVPGGYGSDAVPGGDVGTDRQRRQLSAGQLPLEHPAGAGAQPQQHAVGDGRRSEDVVGGSGRADRRQALDAPGSAAPSTSTVYIADFKTGKWPAPPATDNLQVNAAGMALMSRTGSQSYIPMIYYARDGFWDIGREIVAGTAQWMGMFGQVKTAALLDETPRPGTHCGSCWERKTCAHAASK